MGIIREVRKRIRGVTRVIRAVRGGYEWLPELFERSGEDTSGCPSYSSECLPPTLGCLPPTRTFTTDSQTFTTDSQVFTTAARTFTTDSAFPTKYQVYLRALTRRTHATHQLLSRTYPLESINSPFNHKLSTRGLRGLQKTIAFACKNF